jgi:pimeloyl-ACP methyl ester carboxylesterase
MRRIFAAMCALSLTLSAASPQAADPGRAAIADAWWGSYFKDSKFVTLADGRRLNLFCQGSGGPVVILESGVGSAAWSWRMVQAAMARSSKVCSYDRSGYGLSPATGTPRTAGAEADDLAQLLERAHLPGPYVLVGHSMAGYILRLYAGRHPERVAGLVLVDPSSERQNARFIAAVPQAAPVIGKVEDAARNCIAQGSGPDCGAIEPQSNPPAQWLDAWRAADPARLLTRARETAAFQNESSGQVIAERRPLPIPLILLTRGRLETFQLPGITADQAILVGQVWRQMQLESLAWFMDPQLRVVDGTSHPIQTDRPQAVIDAVREMTDGVRNAAR